METKKIETIKQVEDKYDTFLFDCDGVLWRAGNPIPGTFELLQYLHSKGKNIFFISNSSAKCRDEY